MIEKATMLLSREDIDRTLHRVAHEIAEKHQQRGDVPALVGLRTRGDVLAARLRGLLESLFKTQLDMGVLDIGLYRDDVEMGNSIPELRSTDIGFDVDGRHIILVDDVLYTGRTIRAALNFLFDLGRPRRVELVVLIDRGHRELPIRPDYIGREVNTRSDEKIRVSLVELDKEDGVHLVRQNT